MNKRVAPHRLRHPGIDADPLRDGRLHNFRTQPLPRPRKVRDPLRLLQQSATLVAGTAVQILSERPNRRYLLIQNASTSAATVLVSFGSIASAASAFEIPPGASLEIKDPCTADFVSALIAAGTAQLKFVDG